jgi:endo-1,4-beta-D-glucanase Y
LKRTRKALLFFGIILVVLAAGISVTVGYLGSRQRTIPLVYANSAMLYELWTTYKATDLEPSTDRTIDHSQPDNITTSEGESYTMLRSVWVDDQSTFDKSFAWTQQYLQRPDHLFSWKYGELPNGSYGVNTSNGNYNTASDADTDIALSLLMAYSRWNEAKYLQAAQPIITSIWNEEVVNVNDKPVMTADDMERDSKTTVVVDPSYFNPAAYKIFARIDPSHDWLGLRSNSYTLLSRLSASSLGSTTSDGLPPDWIELNRGTGAAVANASPALDTNFGYDAFRIPFYLALDYQWFHNPRDAQVLSGFSFLASAWNSNHLLDAVYAHDGTATGRYQDPAMYGATIGYFMVEDPRLAVRIYQEKLQTLYSPDKQSWRQNLAYYDDNWAWFGLALSQKALPNLTTNT